MPHVEDYTIGELAQIAEVTTRTIRYYVAEELLSAPEGSGRAATYHDEHLARLRLIKLLKDEYLPLHEIRTLLSGLDYQAVIELLAEKQKSESPLKPAPNSAKEYLRTLLHPPEESEQIPRLMRHKVKIQKRLKKVAARSKSRGVESTDQAGEEAARAPAAPRGASSPDSASLAPDGEAVNTAGFQVGVEEKPARAETDSTALPAQAPIQPKAAVRAAEVTRPETLTRWQRIQITPDVELHVKEGLENSSLWQKIEQLIKIAQQLLASII